MEKRRGGVPKWTVDAISDILVQMMRDGIRWSPTLLREINASAYNAMRDSNHIGKGNSKRGWRIVLEEAKKKVNKQKIKEMSLKEKERRLIEFLKNNPLTLSEIRDKYKKEYFWLQDVGEGRAPLGYERIMKMVGEVRKKEEIKKPKEEVEKPKEEVAKPKEEVEKPKEEIKEEKPLFPLLLALQKDFEELFKVIESYSLSTQELDIIQKYRELDDSKKNMLITYLNFLKEYKNKV